MITRIGIDLIVIALMFSFYRLNTEYMWNGEVHHSWQSKVIFLSAVIGFSLIIFTV